jgi:hypothetical protein
MHLFHQFPRLIFCLLLFSALACSDKLLYRRYYAYNNAWLEQRVGQAVTEGKTGEYPLFVLEGHPLKGEQIRDHLSAIRQEDVKEVEVLSKKEAKRKYGAMGRQGAVEITPVTDERLSSEYYDYNNPLLTQLVDQFRKRNMVQAHPLYVLDGQPLGGEDIRTRLSALDDEEIAAVEVLKQTVAYEIYGIRAHNGVVLISTKERRKEGNN